VATEIDEDVDSVAGKGQFKHFVVGPIFPMSVWGAGLAGGVSVALAKQGVLL